MNGTQRVVALSSTSRFTTDDSSDPEEQAVARRLAEAEARVQAWAENRGASSRHVTDVYLLALATAQGGCFVTLDRGIPLDAVGGALPEHLVVIS